ncbi:MAG: DUF3343 domain-containing protein [Syntrophomonadaceae bacterium]|nr:DUF3343 domain-containing protein [Syntrophomonadaceae bacterium]
MSGYCYATFHSEYDALVFERVMKECGLPVKLLPVPRFLSSSCGVAARFSANLYEQVVATCNNRNLQYDGIMGTPY